MTLIAQTEWLLIGTWAKRLTGRTNNAFIMCTTPSYQERLVPMNQNVYRYHYHLFDPPYIVFYIYQFWTSSFTAAIKLSNVFYFLLSNLLRPISEVLLTIAVNIIASRMLYRASTMPITTAPRPCSVRLVNFYYHFYFY